MRILCIHGIGHGDVNTEWQARWESAIAVGLGQAVPAVRRPTISFFAFDHVFEAADLDAGVVAKAAGELLLGTVKFGLEDSLFGQPGGRALDGALRWTAGVVAQWMASEPLRAQLCQALADTLACVRPDTIVAHSLGSLIAYDAFRRDPSLVANRWFLTFGSQIGFPAVRARFGGRIAGIGTERGWFHLYNRHDRVFTASLARRSVPGVTELETPFDLPDMLDHDGAAYLEHRVTRNVWTALAGGGTVVAARAMAATRAVPKPKRRALLVGINEYPEPSSRLAGCVNDTFLMSAVLQENGFDPADIRMLHDARATTTGIRERLSWLLEDAAEGSERVLFYSGHGAQVPNYGIGDHVDRLDECLVPYDFDWTRQHAIFDDELAEFYAQLPYGTRFSAIFDCCHSGGLTRQNGARARGLGPPPDIAHRALAWDARRGRWFSREIGREESGGDDGTLSTRRIGGATGLRAPEKSEYNAARAQFGHLGPYVPGLLYACAEAELAFEHRDGNTAYGAFTFSLAQELRVKRKAGTTVSLRTLVAGARRRVRALGFTQNPRADGPRTTVGSGLFGSKLGRGPKGG